jgi:hypothetical protein
MPKKGRKGGGGKDSCLMPFHFAQFGQFVGGLAAFNITPAVFPRVALEADVWAHFRIRKLAFRLMPTSPSTVAQAAGFVGGAQDSNPSTFAQVAELLPSCVKGVGQTIPSNWVHPSRSELAGPFPWYKTVAGSADVTEEIPGALVIVGTGTEDYSVEFKGVFEFKTGVNSANTPLELKLRALVRRERVENMQRLEREAILKILSTAPTGPKIVP